MKFSILLATGFLATTLTAQAQAQNRGLPVWEIGAAGGVVSMPAYPASTERRFHHYQYITTPHRVADAAAQLGHPPGSGRAAR